MWWVLPMLLAAHVAPGTPTVSGALDVAVVKRTLERGRGQLRYCYEQALKKKPSLAGRIVVRFGIGADGHVTSAEVTVRVEKDLDECFASHIRRWEFPKPDRGTALVQVPFDLSAS